MQKELEKERVQFYARGGILFSRNSRKRSILKPRRNPLALFSVMKRILLLKKRRKTKLQGLSKWRVKVVKVKVVKVGRKGCLLYILNI